MQYTLTNSYLKATFETFGAELISLQDTDGKEYVWCGDSAFWGRHAPILFPVVGKLSNGKYRFNGQEYSMGQHGFARDMEFAFLSQNEEEIWFVLESTEETKQKYPFDFRLEVGYKLVENTLKVLWKVINPAEEVLHFSIGAHPAFMCPVDEGTKQSDYFLKLDVNEAEFYPASLITGQPVMEKQTLSLSDGKVQMTEEFFNIGENRGTYIFENYQIKEAALARPDGRPYVTLSFDTPLVAVWTPEKKNAPFVCIEPWYGRGDAEGFEGSLDEREWANQLAPGQIFEGGYDIRIDK